MGTLVCALCCDEEFSNRLLLKYHLLSVADNIFCPECNRRFGSILQLANHLDKPCGEESQEIQINENLEKNRHPSDVHIEHTHIVPEIIETVIVGDEISEMDTDKYVEHSEVPMTEVLGDNVQITNPEDMVEQNMEESESQIYFSEMEEKNIQVETIKVENNLTVPDPEECAVTNVEDNPTLSEPGVSAIAEEYSCSGCGVTFTSVVDHIKMFHDGQEVVLEVPETDKSVFLSEDTEVQISGTTDLVDASSSAKAQNIEMAKPILVQNIEGNCAVKTTELIRKRKTRVVADEERLKRIAYPNSAKSVENVKASTRNEFRYVSKEVKIGRFWENQIGEARLKQNISETTELPGVIRSEENRGPVRRDARTSIEKLFSGNHLLKAPSGRRTRPDSFLRVSRIPEVKVIMSPGDEGAENAISVFTCSSCQQEFGNVVAFERHSCPLTRTCKLICKICNVTIPDMKTFRLHMEVTHNTKTEMSGKVKKKYNLQLFPEPLKCGSCDRAFKSVRALKVHEKSHLNPDEFPKECVICHNICSSQRTLSQHMRVHDKPLPSRELEESNAIQSINTRGVQFLSNLVCKICCKSFENNEDLRSHWQEHTTIVVERNENDGCLEELNSSQEQTVPGTLETHVTEKDTSPSSQCHKEIDNSCKEEHPMKRSSQSKWVCPICNSRFDKPGLLKVHIQIHKDKKDYTCSQCNKNFPNWRFLRIHLESHPEYRPYMCDFCGRGFFRPHSKMEHERVHTGEKPHVCSVCGMRFRVQYCLTLHMRRHTGIRPYRCKFCGKTFRTGTAYKAHIKIHLDERAYKCPFCPKKFNTQIQLSGHKNSHTKPYTCVKCNRPFSSLYAVKKHMTSHEEGAHGKDPLKYQCQVCGASYARKFALEDHLQSCGQNLPAESAENLCFD